MIESAKTILVVDDEEKIVDVVTSYLRSTGYDVVTAGDGKAALALFERVQPDLVVLDLMLPDLSGEQVCAAIRARSRTPIIMLTAKVEEGDVINGLHIGADDYMTKPFSPRQLVARVGAVLRRSAAEAIPLASRLTFGGGELSIDQLRHEVRKNGEIVALTPNEYKLLLTMATYPTKAFTREELIACAFGDDFDGFDRVIDSHIKNLRQKIEQEPKTPRYVQTVYGVGYKFGGEHIEG